MIVDCAPRRDLRSGRRSLARSLRLEAVLLRLEAVLLDRVMWARRDDAVPKECAVQAGEDGGDRDEEGNVLHQRVMDAPQSG